MAMNQVPTRSLSYHGRLTLWWVLLIIAVGLAAQSVQVNIFTQSTVDETYANAIAQQMAQAFRLRLLDTQKLQLSASQHPYTLNALQEGDAVWLNDLKGFLPGSQTLQLILPEQALGLYQTQGYAVQELVSRTLKGANMRLEAVRNSEGTIRLFWATPIRLEQAIVGVLLVEYGPAWLTQFQAVVDQSLGEIQVMQYVDDEHQHSIQILKAGQATKAGARVVVPINDDWFLSFVPNDERPQLALIPVIGPWIMVLLAVLLSLVLMLLLQNREVRQNQLMLVNYVRSLNRLDSDPAEMPTFTLSLFYELAVMLQKQSKPTGAVGFNLAAVIDGERSKPDLALEPLSRKQPRTRPAAVAEMEVEELTGSSPHFDQPQTPEPPEKSGD